MAIGLIMNRLELPAPPAPQPIFPLPPAPRTGPAQPTDPVTRGPRHALVSVAIGLALVLITGIGGVVASHPSKGASRPLFGGERSHAFIGRSADGEPYRWDPCSTIHYQVDLGQMDDRVLDDVNEAVRRISRASGLALEFDGIVHVSVNDLVSSGDFVTATTAGLHWSPVLIAFRSRSAMRALGVRGAYGVAMPVTTRFDAEQFVSGVVVINASAGLEDGFDRAPSMGTVLQHELGHAVGLGHILDPFQLMSPVPVVTDWGRGDLAGLEELGDAPCLDVPTAEYQAAIFPAP
ncbi:MAG TPA: hypothetical protein VFU18_01040 [Actinomycetota bacterium]|nr:hypothetical protein [Actinomycetota bacterium]